MDPDGLPDALKRETAIAVAGQDSDIRNLTTLIVGPPDSPYQYGFFEFEIKFGKEYPTQPPSVRALTTNHGKCRFNPNIYANGKVCLSILGTWTGESGEQWSSAQGLESILISIQSLLSSNPYENEPSYEDRKGPGDKKNMASYIAKIRHETLRIAVIRPLEESLDIRPDGGITRPNSKAPPDEEEEDLTLEDDMAFNPFADLRKRRFLWYFDSYLQTIDTAEQVTSHESRFEKMPFESGDNTMDGHFDYPTLRRRLNFIQETIINETQSWAAEGLCAKEREKGIAMNMQRQYEQIVENFKQQKNFTVDLALVGKNPFVWELTYFGRPMTQLDGGIFKVKIHISPRFPDEQPRVFMQSPLFHVRVSRHGVLCYFSQRQEEMRYHVEGIVAALEDENPPYDPRVIVNPEASKLFWGSADERRQYKRALRRSVERCAE
ncbi:ubiquitin conjugating enzyme [Aspergillus sp. HF37]|nr:ubiquitin conjugating enzyme [Aspergillus sp. HF37]